MWLKLPSTSTQSLLPTNHFVGQRVFGSGAVSSLGQKSSSAFLTLPAFLETNPTRPRPDELSQLTETAAPESAGSLRRAAWLRAQGAPPPPVAPQLPLSTADTATAAPESLCRLDVLAFLEATGGSRAVFLPSHIRLAPQRYESGPRHFLCAGPAGASP